MSLSLQDKKLVTTVVPRVTGAPVETMQYNALLVLLVFCSKSPVNRVQMAITLTVLVSEGHILRQL